MGHIWQRSIPSHAQQPMMQYGLLNAALNAIDSGYARNKEICDLLRSQCSDTSGFDTLAVQATACTKQHHGLS